MEKRCCICGREFIDFGHNASPVKDGVCCDNCNKRFVVPGRAYFSKSLNPVSFEISKSLRDYSKIKYELEIRNFEKVEESGYLHIYSNIETEEKVVICIV